MDTGLLRELISALEKAASEPALGALVVTGEGGVFSAGADVVEQVDKTGAYDRMRLFTGLYELVTAFPKPTVAAIAGPCIGAGAEVAACCDLRVGASSARIRFPGAQFGIPVGAARLPLLIGLSHAKDLLMTSRTLDAEEAHSMGFLNRLAEEKNLEEEAGALAQTMAERPGAVIQKRQLDLLWDLSARSNSENRALRRWQAESQTLMGD